jgi:hypothetical protein
VEPCGTPDSMGKGEEELPKVQRENLYKIAIFWDIVL